MEPRQSSQSQLDTVRLGSPLFLLARPPQESSFSLHQWPAAHPSYPPSSYPDRQLSKQFSVSSIGSLDDGNSDDEKQAAETCRLLAGASCFQGRQTRGTASTGGTQDQVRQQRRQVTSRFSFEFFTAANHPGGVVTRPIGSEDLDSDRRFYPPASPNITDAAMDTNTLFERSSLGSQVMPDAGELDCSHGKGQGHGVPGSQRQRRDWHLSGSAAVELFIRLQRARQTYDFCRRQAVAFSLLPNGHMGCFEALHTLNELREYEANLLSAGDDEEQLDPDMTLLEHALQTAELCRRQWPDRSWMHVVGLLHGLGKLLAHARFGAQPQWAVCGESYPVGCRPSSDIVGAQFYSANPDRRRRAFAGSGIYLAGCGLRTVTMSWSGSEWLHMVLRLNAPCSLPKEALFCLRFQKFKALTGGSYNHLLDGEDREMLPLLQAFQDIIQYKRVLDPPLQLDAQTEAHYSELLLRFGLAEDLLW